MAIMLKAVVYGSPGRTSVRDISAPRARRGEVRVRIENASICGTDIHFYSGEWAARKGIILGHDASGILHGSGRRVALEFQKWCGSCRYCKSGMQNLCAETSYMGFDSNGFFAEEAVLPEKNVYRIPDSISMEEAACLEPAALAIHTLDVLRPRKTGWVVVIGQGPVGLCITQVARLRGLRVIAADMLDHRLRLSSMYGADHVIDCSAVNPVPEIRRASRNSTLYVVEAAGSRSAVREALEVVTADGRLAFVSGAQDAVSLEAETNVVAVVAYTIAEKRRALKMVEGGLLDVGSMITHRFPMAEFEKAIRTASDPRKKAVKVLLHN